MTHPRHTATFAATPEQTAHARHWLATLLGPTHPCPDTAVLLLSETFTNSVLHSRSNAPGGTIEVTAELCPAYLRVEVIDAGAPAAPPDPAPATPDAEHGRGLHLVAALAEGWGHATLSAGRLRTHFILTAD